MLDDQFGVYTDALTPLHKSDHLWMTFSEPNYLLGRFSLSWKSPKMTFCEQAYHHDDLLWVDLPFKIIFSTLTWNWNPLICPFHWEDLPGGIPNSPPNLARTYHQGDLLWAVLQRKYDLCVPRKGIALPHQYPHSCVWERFIYYQDRSTYFPAAE